MFDLSIYSDLLRITKAMILRTEKAWDTFMAEDIVHDLYLSEILIDKATCYAHISKLIRSERASSPRIFIEPRIYYDTYICAKCKEPMPANAFYIMHALKDSHYTYISSYCRLCSSSDSRERYGNRDIEKSRARAECYYWDNRARISGYRKKYWKQKTVEERAIKREYDRKWKAARRIQCGCTSIRKYDWETIDPKIKILFAESKTLSQIAIELGVPLSSIESRKKKLGLPNRREKAIEYKRYDWGKLDKEITSLMEGGMLLKNIERKLNIGHCSLSKRVKELCLNKLKRDTHADRY